MLVFLSVKCSDQDIITCLSW